MCYFSGSFQRLFYFLCPEICSLLGAKSQFTQRVYVHLVAYGVGEVPGPVQYTGGSGSRKAARVSKMPLGFLNELVAKIQKALAKPRMDGPMCPALRLSPAEWTLGSISGNYGEGKVAETTECRSAWGRENITPHVLNKHTFRDGRGGWFVRVGWRCQPYPWCTVGRRLSRPLV